MKSYENIYTPLLKAFLSFPLLLLLFMLQGCEKFEYSPYEVRLSKDEQGLNQRNIERILSLNLSPADTLRFVLTADTQGFYEDNEALVKELNKRGDINFVLLGGDITDFGLLKEFRWVHESFDKLKVPYVAVIGNHDATGNGKQVFKAMYGEYDFSFTVAKRKFIFLNTNYLEFGKQAPDLDWLDSAFGDPSTYDHVFVVSHIPPASPEFGEENAVRYGEILRRRKASLSIHGHTHNFKYYKMQEEGVYHLDVATTNKREYIVMSVFGKHVDFERVKF
ncbi:MAG: metallophosphoesterase [Hymenobacteraceae bacterium]|mgnify:CR=1 FL=1|nr:metallophosphoesterase [Hymenobacteraceae bacterium]MDX5481038.1 metallophosphoesterase [Hymenobacteraceae bacterium]